MKQSLAIAYSVKRRAKKLAGSAPVEAVEASEEAEPVQLEEQDEAPLEVEEPKKVNLSEIIANIRKRR